MSYLIKDRDGKAVIVKNQNALGIDIFDDVEIKDFNNAERSFVAVANQETEDRYKDIIMVDGWDLKNYKKNPVVMPFHDYRSLPVGRALEIFKDEKRGVKRLMFRPQFAAYPEPMRMYEMYRDGYLKGFSVGFLSFKEEPIEDDKDDEKSFMFHRPTRYLKCELLENSAVPIPAHPDALSEIKGMVKKGSLYIPARFLRKEEDPEIELIGEFVHVLIADANEFDTLYVKEFENVTAVYGKKDDELLPCKWIMGSDYCCPDVALEWTNEISEDLFKSIVDEQKSDDPPAMVIYDPEKYESKDVVMVNDMPLVEMVKFEVEEKKVKFELEEIEKDEDDEEVEIEDEDNWTIDEINELDIDFEDSEFFEADELEKPFPNEHACRLEAPGGFEKFARKNCFRKSGKKCIDFIFGIKDGKSTVQALRYKKITWTADDAKAHCAARNGTFEAAGKEVEPIETAELTPEMLTSINQFMSHMPYILAGLQGNIEKLEGDMKDLLEKINEVYELVIDGRGETETETDETGTLDNEGDEEIIEIEEDEVDPEAEEIEEAEGDDESDEEIELDMEPEEFKTMIGDAINSSLGRLKN